MNKNKELRERIIKGIDYLKPLKPSQFDASKGLIVKRFVDLVELYLNKEKENSFENAKKIF